LDSSCWHKSQEIERRDMGSSSGGGRHGLADFDDKRLCVNVQEAAALLGISRNLAYELVRRHELPVVKFGRRLLVPRAALEKLLERV